MARSTLVYSALVNIPSRFKLCHHAIKGTRAFHVPTTDIAQTINLVLIRIGSVSPASGEDEFARSSIASRGPRYRQRC